MGAGGGDSGCGSGLLGVTNKLHSPDRTQYFLILLTLGNATIMHWIYPDINHNLSIV